MSAWISPAQAAEAIEQGDGHGVRIAVLDSGIETSHPNFSGRRLHDDVVSEANGQSYARGMVKTSMATGPRLRELSGSLRRRRKLGASVCSDRV